MQTGRSWVISEKHKVRWNPLSLIRIHNFSAGIGQPLGLWRDVAENDSIPRGNGLPDMEVKKGDRVFADFNRAHMNVCLCLQYDIMVADNFPGCGFP
jgi:hypothetical protein